MERTKNRSTNMDESTTPKILITSATTGNLLLNSLFLFIAVIEIISAAIPLTMEIPDQQLTSDSIPITKAIIDRLRTERFLRSNSYCAGDICPCVV